MNRQLLSALAALLLTSCVAGSKIRADSEVIQNDIEKAERSGAKKCAPRELATARAELDFANGELMQGNSFRASDHIAAAKVAVRKAKDLSKDCGPKQIVVREKDQPEVKKPPAVVVRIEETDSDNDGIPDKDDKCSDKGEDKDGFEDEDGCPDPDNDKDEVLDGNDKCPLVPGPFSNQGCPVEAPKDADGDGVVDSLDKCPGQTEDKDGFKDEDGCPEVDNDEDGLSDAKDKCPNQAGDYKNDGCPDGDSDGDTVPDSLDRCPREPEDADSYQDKDGCPDLDNDGDGIPDTQDNCPNQGGTTGTKGCPDLDNDQDGVPDSQDKCPNQAGAPVTGGCPIEDRDTDGVPDDKDRCPIDAEDKDGFKDEDGCPDNNNDSDELPDNADKCPDASGPVTNQGCPITDRDTDGVEDAQDKCPGQAEDKDGFEDEDGCPDPDNDGDKTPDRGDKCPNEAGPVEAFGCPDVDRDADGVVDRDDKCPGQGEDKDGFEDNDGCPDPDNDKDGVLDGQDKCPTEVGLADNNGCPDADKDGDGVVDRNDKCPEQFGRDGTGCQKKYKMVVVQKDRIQINKQILYGPGSAKIVGKESQAVIADVAAALKDNPQIKKIRIEGHTDSQGNDAANLRLSQKRADAVMSALIRAGIDPERMVSVGFGETQPIASNASKAGRAENRRTEFNIVQQ